MKSDKPQKTRKRTKFLYISTGLIVTFLVLGIIRAEISYNHNPTHISLFHIHLLNYIILSCLLGWTGLVSIYRMTKHRWL